MSLNFKRKNFLGVVRSFFCVGTMLNTLNLGKAFLGALHPQEQGSLIQENLAHFSLHDVGEGIESEKYA